MNPLNDPWSAHVRGSRVRSASEMVAITDSNGDGQHDFLSCPGPNPVWLPGRVHPNKRVHSGGANVLFCDGHVQWYPESDLVFGPTENDYSRSPRARRWNNDNQ